MREFPPTQPLLPQFFPTQPLLQQYRNGFNTSHSSRRELPQIPQNGSQPCRSEDQICPSECLIRSNLEVIIPQTAPSPFLSEPQVILRASPAISTSTATLAEPLHQPLTVREAPPPPQPFLKVKTTSNASTPVTRCCECWPLSKYRDRSLA